MLHRGSGTRNQCLGSNRKQQSNDLLWPDVTSGVTKNNSPKLNNAISAYERRQPTGVLEIAPIHRYTRLGHSYAAGWVHSWP